MTIDVNVSLSRWPSRRLPLDETPRLVERLVRHGVTQAWAGSFDAILHNDIAAVNHRLATECSIADNGLLWPMGAVNLKLPNWKDDLKRCHETHGMRGIRLLPSSHGYGLDDPEFAELLGMLSDFRMLLQIAIRLEDPRTQHRLLSVKDVELAPLPSLMKEHPDVPVILLNAFPAANSELASLLATSGRVYFEIATLEGLAGLEKQIQLLPPERLLFGSHAPFFMLESAVLKLQESALPAPIQKQITHENAESLINTLEK